MCMDCKCIALKEYFLHIIFLLCVLIMNFFSLDRSLARYSSHSSIDILPDEIFMKVCMN